MVAEIEEHTLNAHNHFAEAQAKFSEIDETSEQFVLLPKIDELDKNCYRLFAKVELKTA